MKQLPKFEKVSEIGDGGCYDCGLSYEDFGIDMVLPDSLWDVISPSVYRGSGILCANCICRRLAQFPVSCIRVIPDLSEVIRDMYSLQPTQSDTQGDGK